MILWYVINAKIVFTVEGQNLTDSKKKEDAAI